MDFKFNTCENEYAKDPRIKKEDIQQLSEWLQKQIHMPPVGEYLQIQFYYASKCSLQQTKTLLDLHYTFRNEAPEFFTSPEVDQKKFKYSIWDVVYAFTIPESTGENRRIYYTCVRDTDARNYSFEKAMTLMVCTLLTTLLENGVCPGYEIIFDLQGFSLAHFSSVTISLIKKLVYFAQDLAPVIINGIHIINGYKIFDKFMFLAERFMKKELFEIIHIHSKPDDLFKFVPKDYIPVDLGGTYKHTRDELNDLMRAKLTACESVIMKEFELKTDESKRIGEKKDLTSMNGTFRKLQLD